MVDNPQLLVPLVRNGLALNSLPISSTLDAIYIPFRQRIGYIKELLKELSHFAGNIYLLPSGTSNMQSIKNYLVKNVQVIHDQDPSLCDFYLRLVTSNHKHTKNYIHTWDLPKKRNFIIQHALLKHHKRILLVDDDIRTINASCLAAGAICLDNYAQAGCFVDDFLNTSVLGHLERAAGEHVAPFLSGSFLFVKPVEALGFFPCLYNEDWLFMLPHVLNGSICSFGSINQVPFDPFDDIARPLFQEFGEIIAEGLYALFAGKQYSRRHEKETWLGILEQRKRNLTSLSYRLPQLKHKKIIAAMLEANSNITAEDCSTFVRDWETDLKSWQSYIRYFK